VTAAAIYARVSSARQAKDQTIGSQLSALREHAATSRLDVPEEWVFADEGQSGATLVRPALEALRDLAAQGCLDVVLVWSPDRLARKFAYQALLIEELARCGVRVEFVKGPRGDSPEDQLLIQFQGMFAEYEKAQLMERYRRGKAWRAKTGSVNVLGGAPFGYRYVRKTPECGARYEVLPHEAALVTEMFRRYADDGATIADLRRWLTDQGILTRTGKERWDRSVIWGMLRNPAYAGTAVFGKTQVVHEPAGLNRTARLAGRTVPRQVRVQDRPREEWTAIPVPALVGQETFDRVQQRLAENKRFASRNTKVPSLLQGIAACASCGYGYYRTTTTTTAGNKIYYYRCLGSDDYRYQGGRVCQNKPVRADYADTVVWDHVTALLADPALIHAEIGKRLERARTSDPVTKKRGQLEQALAKTGTSIAAMITAFSEQLLTIDELRARMPALRARETGLKDQIAALDAQAADRDAYLTLAGDLEGFLARLRENSATATTGDRQRVLRAVVQDVLIGPDKLTIRHRIPVREPASGGGHHDTTDTEGDMRESSLLRWGRELSSSLQCDSDSGHAEGGQVRTQRSRYQGRRLVTVRTGPGQYRQRPIGLLRGQIVEACLGQVGGIGELADDVPFSQEVRLHIPPPARRHRRIGSVGGVELRQPSRDSAQCSRRGVGQAGNSAQRMRGFRLVSNREQACHRDRLRCDHRVHPIWPGQVCRPGASKPECLFPHQEPGQHLIGDYPDRPLERVIAGVQHCEQRSGVQHQDRHRTHRDLHFHQVGHRRS
jgi:site-specific DNA recombinase